MTDQNKSYLLAYGFRRLSACIKLGWVKIPAYLKEEGVFKEVDIKDIVVTDNTRFDANDEEFIELMNSIKQHGLLEPIGLTDVHKTTRQQFIITNLLENIQRRDISPLELSKAINDLKKEGYNLAQISSALSLPLSRLETLERLSEKMPQEELKNATYTKNTRENTGDMPISVLNAISHKRWREEKNIIPRVIKVAKSKNMGVRDIELLSRLNGAGMNLDKAVKHAERYKVTTVVIIVNKKMFEDNRKKIYGKKSIKEIINQMLKGKIPLNPKMFYYKSNAKEKDD